MISWKLIFFLFFFHRLNGKYRVVIYSGIYIIVLLGLASKIYIRSDKFFVRGMYMLKLAFITHTFARHLLTYYRQ
ncbi:uncharacterized protein EV154DRAFT_512173 [Mucor mucedo]|uniref:uncharacterized protein n=1 Tax=Mucor mucedo TaxID=29922 RepID=UPI00221F8204|nr:uncharacterized protein EV154DRAFT_512173 [Mucor mucedo]KAI7890164.1 hypothetical protein EV154DRAFT_512173 [Mucor mucedo]